MMITKQVELRMPQERNIPFSFKFTAGNVWKEDHIFWECLQWFADVHFTDPRGPGYQCFQDAERLNKISIYLAKAANTFICIYRYPLFLANQPHLVKNSRK